MITPLKELEEIGPNLGFSSLPNPEEAWNLFVVSGSISDSHQCIIVSVFWNGPLEAGGLCINHKIPAEARSREWLNPPSFRVFSIHSFLLQNTQALRILLADSRAQKHFRCQPSRNTGESNTSLMLRLWYEPTCAPQCHRERLPLTCSPTASSGIRKPPWIKLPRWCIFKPCTTEADFGT